MMKSFVLLFLAAVMTAGVTASAATVRFRSGEILRAELSSREPEILAFTKTHRTGLPANPVWAVLTVTLDPGRKISIHDYSIRYMGTLFPAVALAQNDAAFDTRHWELPAQPGLRCHLLFALDDSVLEDKSSPRPLTLVSNAVVPSEQKVPFTVRGRKAFTRTKSIPESGLFPEVK